MSVGGLLWGQEGVVLVGAVLCLPSPTEHSAGLALL
jgi:hypothetical protein